MVGGGPGARGKPLELSVREVARRRVTDPDNLLLIDCRRQDEWDLVRLDGAELRPMERLGEWIEEIAERVEAGEGSAGVVVYCHHGRRSLIVARALRQAGIDAAASMAGGIDVWSMEVDPGVRRYTAADLR